MTTSGGSSENVSAIGYALAVRFTNPYACPFGSYFLHISLGGYTTLAQSFWAQFPSLAVTRLALVCAVFPNEKNERER